MRAVRTPRSLAARAGAALVAFGLFALLFVAVPMAAPAGAEEARPVYPWTEGDDLIVGEHSWVMGSTTEPRIEYDPEMRFVTLPGNSAWVFEGWIKVPEGTQCDLTTCQLFNFEDRADHGGWPDQSYTHWLKPGYSATTGDLWSMGRSRRLDGSTSYLRHDESGGGNAPPHPYNRDTWTLLTVQYKPGTNTTQWYANGYSIPWTDYSEAYFSFGEWGTVCYFSGRGCTGAGGFDGAFAADWSIRYGELDAGDLQARRDAIDAGQGPSEPVEPPPPPPEYEAGDCVITDAWVTDDILGTKVVELSGGDGSGEFIGAEDYYWRTDRTYTAGAVVEPFEGFPITDAVEITVRFVMGKYGDPSTFVQKSLGTVPAGTTEAVTLTSAAIQLPLEGSAIVQLVPILTGTTYCGTRWVSGYDPNRKLAEDMAGWTAEDLSACFESVTSGGSWLDRIGAALDLDGWVSATWCLLRVAFTPSVGMRPYVRPIMSDLEVGPLGFVTTLVRAPQTAIASLDGDGSCQGPTFTYRETEVAPLSACSAGMADVQNVVQVGLGLLVYAGGAIVCARILGGAFGVKVGIGGGGDE